MLFARSPCEHAEHLHHVVQHKSFWHVCETGSLPSSLPLFVQVVCLGLQTRECCRPSLPLRLHLPLPVRLALNLKQDQEQQIAKVQALGWLLRSTSSADSVTGTSVKTMFQLPRRCLVVKWEAAHSASQVIRSAFIVRSLLSSLECFGSSPSWIFSEEGSDPICISVPYLYHFSNLSNFWIHFSDFRELGCNFWRFWNLYHL